MKNLRKIKSKKAIVTVSPKNYSVIADLFHPDEAIKVKAAMELGERKVKGSMPHLLKALELKGQSTDFRYHLVTALGMNGDKSVIPILKKIVGKEPDQNIRDRAISALGEIGHPTSAPFLIRILEKTPLTQHRRSNKQIWTATAAILALGEIGHASAISPIMKRLTEDENEGIIQFNAIKAMKRISEKLFEKKPDPTFKDPHYAFTLLNYKQTPMAFRRFFEDMQNPSLSHFTKKQLDLYAKQLKVKEPILKRIA